MSGNSLPCTFFGYLILIEWSLYQGSLAWVWGSELLTLGCIQISQVTSHNQQTLFSRHSVPLLGHSIYVRLRQQAMLLLFIKILQLKNFFFKLPFFVGCVLSKAREWYTSTVEQQNWVTRKSWWSACCVSILEWIQHKSHALYVSHELKEKKRNVCCVPENSHLRYSLRAPR